MVPTPGVGLTQVVHRERLNGVLRDRLNALTRKTHGLAKDVQTWDALVSLCLFEHNWLRPHPALREPAEGLAYGRRYRRRTPAMAIGLTDHVWTWDVRLRKLTGELLGRTPERRWAHPEAEHPAGVYVHLEGDYTRDVRYQFVQEPGHPVPPGDLLPYYLKLGQADGGRALGHAVCVAMFPSEVRDHLGPLLRPTKRILSASSSSFVTTHPPTSEPIVFSESKEKATAWPRVPVGRTPLTSECASAPSLALISSSCRP